MIDLAFHKTETLTSFKVLEDVSKFGFEINLMGGWAVHLLVNKEFQKREKRSYVGSRDLDIAFPMDINWDEKTLKSSELFLALSKIKQLGFKGYSFRFYKEFNVETGKEFRPEESKKVAPYEIFKMCIDPMVPRIPSCFKKVFGFVPIDESLLDYFFNQNHKIKAKFNNCEVNIPSVELMAAMKVKCSKGRTKHEKKVKDIADFFVLLWYTEGFENVKKKLFKIIPRSEVLSIITTWDKMLIDEAAKFIGIDSKTLNSVFAHF